MLAINSLKNTWVFLSLSPETIPLCYEVLRLVNLMILPYWPPSSLHALISFLRMAFRAGRRLNTAYFELKDFGEQKENGVEVE
jgi:hypothetical protein